MKIKTASILILIILTISFFNCTKKTQAVKSAFNQYTGDLPFFIAFENGYFEKYGLIIDFKEAGNSSEALNALLAGKVDVINPISFSAMIAAEANTPGQIKLFLPGGENEKVIGSYLLIRKDSNFNSLDDLKGRKIGTYTGATQFLYLKLFLQEAGYNPEKDFEIVQVDFNLQVQALEAGQFDALFTIEPSATIALQKDVAKVLIENPRVKYIVNPFISGSAAFSTKFVRENPNTVKIIYQAVAEALDFIRTNEKDARKILTKYTPLDSTLADKTNLLVWYKVDELSDYQPIQKIADLFYENGIIKEKIDIQKMFLKKDDLI